MGILRIISLICFSLCGLLKLLNSLDTNNNNNNNKNNNKNMPPKNPLPPMGSGARRGLPWTCPDPTCALYNKPTRNWCQKCKKTERPDADQLIKKCIIKVSVASAAAAAGDSKSAAPTTTGSGGAAIVLNAKNTTNLGFLKDVLEKKCNIPFDKQLCML